MKQFIRPSRHPGLIISRERDDLRCCGILNRLYDPRVARGSLVLLQLVFALEKSQNVSWEPLRIAPRIVYYCFMRS